MSNNLDLDQVSSGQANKETTINDQSGQLDAAMTEDLLVEVDNSNAATLTNDQFRRNQFFTIDEDGGTPATAAITITVPAIKRGTFVVINDTAFDVTVEITSQPDTSPVVSAGDKALLSCDGTNVNQPAGGGSSGSDFYDVAMAYDGGPPGSSEIMAKIAIVREVTFPADFSGSVGDIGTNPTATFDIDVQDDGGSIGTISISTGGVFTFTTVSGTAKVVAAGSILTFVAPASTDATAADFAATLLGTA